jgi:hypothetical protein
MSWIRIKNGYAANQELYGTSKIQLNEFAHLAARANDHAAALKVFLEIGDNYDKDTWRKRRTFESYKQWAIAPSEEFMQKWQASANEMQAPGGAQYFQQTERDLMQKNDSVVKQCMELFRDDKQQFQVALKLDSHGDAQEVSVWPPTRISSCVLPKLVKHVTAPPPKPTFWVILTFLNSVPTMQSKEGPPLPESGF